MMLTTIATTAGQTTRYQQFAAPKSDMTSYRRRKTPAPGWKSRLKDGCPTLAGDQLMTDMTGGWGAPTSNLHNRPPLQVRWRGGAAVRHVV